MNNSGVNDMVFCKLLRKSVASIKAYDYHYSVYDSVCNHCNLCTKEKEDKPTIKRGGSDVER